MRVLHLFAASLLAHLPFELGDAAGGATAPHEANWRVADFDLVRDVEDLDLRVKLTSLPERGVLFVDHHIAGPRHVVLVETLDVQADVVPRVCEVHTLVVHLYSEHLAGTWVRSRVRWEEDHFLARLHHPLLDTPCEHVTDTLDLVDAGDGHAHGRADGPLWHAAQLVENVVDRVHVDGFLPVLDVLALPPTHVLGLLEQVVAHPAGDRHDRRVLLDEVLLPAYLDEHAFHLVGDLVVARLLVRGGVAVHLVHADADLLHPQEVDQPRVLARLALDLARLVVALRNGSCEVPVSGHHDQGNIGLRRSSDHVLDEVAVAWSVDDRVVPLVGVELLGGARDGHAALPLLLLPVHVEGEGEGTLPKTLGLLLELVQLTLWKSTKLEDETASGGAFPAVDVTADHDGEVLLLGVGGHGCGSTARMQKPSRQN
mmetsp:Transcript_50553/g.140243  ORF Transcript_50553/g.140243 Transcript_50553/m.140243 type:complete len:428 (-) Transcript_50553:19-1302(-)